MNTRRLLDSRGSVTKFLFEIQNFKYMKNLIEKMKVLRIYAVISRFLFPYKTWIEMREKSKDEYGEKLCYCGHTYKCTCSNPDKTLFKESIKRGTITKF